ncbi:hypothetical protein FQR65_LT20647 [Abscondita terminalis]|nr:hypothetical protein FQR65_LT20647 [Abscondita terminalis]
MGCRAWVEYMPESQHSKEDVEASIMLTSSTWTLDVSRPSSQLGRLRASEIPHPPKTKGRCLRQVDKPHERLFVQLGDFSGNPLLELTSELLKNRVLPVAKDVMFKWWLLVEWRGAKVGANVPSA